MKSFALALGLTFLFASAAQAGENEPSRYVYLSSKSAMEKLRREDPSRYAKIEKVLEEMSHRHSEDISGWLKTSYGARDVYHHSMVMLATYPPVQRLYFILDDTRYEATLMLVGDRALVGGR